jgi:hypothetical protein
MESIIRQLFYGNLDPNARCYTKDCSCKGAMDIVAKNEEILSDELEGKLKKLFLDYANAWSEVNATEVVEIFTTGFRMGARFMVDSILMDDNEFDPKKE